MYKILIKYTSTFKKTFWQSYEVVDEDEKSVEFVTDSFEVLKNEVKKLDFKYGHENIRVIKDVTYDVLVDVERPINIGEVEITTSEDIDDIFNTAYNNIF